MGKIEDGIKSDDNNILSNFMGKLYQPINTHFEPSEVKKYAINLAKFLELLRQEEWYYKQQNHDTKEVLSHVRKIFYDLYGWNSQLIRGAAKVSNRYLVKLVPDAMAFYPEKRYALVERSGSNLEPSHLKREVLVRPGDWLNPQAGTVPEIYQNDNQEIILPDHLYCDMGHVLAGMDASNYPMPVAPLPKGLMWLRFLFPHVENNAFCATWLGDIASSAGECLFETIKNKKQLSSAEVQRLIDAFAPGTDMLGNIDSIVIPHVYQLNTRTGWLISDILKDYYSPEGKGYYFMQRRYSVFCGIIGLRGWNGVQFENEREWLVTYKKQLRNTTAFYVYTRMSKLKGLMLALKVWLHLCEPTLNLQAFLELFLEALKKNINTEPLTSEVKPASYVEAN